MSNKNKIINQAQKFIQKGQWDKAIKELQKLVAEDPNDVRTLLKLGDVYAKKGERDQATAVYKQVAESYGEQGFFLKAVAVYKQILKHDPRHLEVTLKLAELYEHLGLTSEAMAQYQIASQIHDESGQLKDALDVLRRMVEIDAENVASRIKLAEGYSRENMIPDAIQEFLRACEILKRQNRTDDYIKVAERLVYHDPTQFEVIKDLAQLYLQKNDTKRGLAKLQLCFKAQPKDVETLTLLADAFRDLGQTQKTIFVYRELSRIHQENGHDSEMRAVLQKILEVDPNDAEARSLLGFGLNSGQMAAQMSAPFGSQPMQNLLAQSFSQQMSAPLGSGPSPAPFAQAPPPGPQGQPMFGSTGTMPLGGGPTSGGMYANANTMSPPPARDVRGAGRSTSTVLHDPYPGPGPGRVIPPPQIPPPPISPPTDFAQSDWPPSGGSDEMIAFEGAVAPPPGDEPSPYAQAIGPPQPPPAPLAGGSRVDTVAIQKVLTETDVYIKYGLRDKALEHLRKIFELDPDNVLAYTKMRDIYLGVGDSARAAESVANLIHIHSRRGDIDALRATRQELERLAPGHPMIAGTTAPTAGRWPTRAQEEVDSIDITENSDAFDASEMQMHDHHPTFGPEPTLDAPEPIASAPDGLDQWFQQDASDTEQPRDPIIDAFDIPPESSGDASPPLPQRSGDVESAFDSSFHGQFQFAEASSVGVSEADIVSTSRADTPPPRFQGFESDTFTEEETDAAANLQRAQFQAHQSLLNLQSPQRAPQDVSDLSLESAAAIRTDPRDEDLPEASSSQVVSLDEVAEAADIARLSHDLIQSPEAHSLSPFDREVFDREVFDREVFASDTSQSEAFEESEAINPETEPATDGGIRLGGIGLLEPEPEPEPEREPELDQHTEDELDEAEFLLGEGLVDDARELVESVLERLPEHPRAISLHAMLASMPSENEEAETEEAVSDEDVAAVRSGNGAAQEQNVGAISDDDLASAFDQVGSGAGSGESPEDHYDQGIAYREVGRLDDAIAHFRKALASPTRQIDSLEMLGHCLLAKGDAEGAISHFWQALENGIEGPAATNLKYEIAGAYQAAGDEQQAVYWFRLCYGDDPQHRDVRSRIEAFGVDPDSEMEGEPQPPSNGTYQPPEEEQTSSAPPKRNKISYL